MLEVAILLVEFVVCGFEPQEDGRVRVIRAPNIRRTAVNPDTVIEVLKLEPPEEIVDKPHAECTALILGGSVRYVRGDYETVKRKIEEARGE